MGLVEQVKEFGSFLALYGLEASKMLKNSENASTEEKMSYTSVNIQAGNIICHKKYGKGVIEKIEDTVIVVRFPEVGEKKLGLKWCVQNCKINKRL